MPRLYFHKGVVKSATSSSTIPPESKEICHLFQVAYNIQGYIFYEPTSQVGDLDVLKNYLYRLNWLYIIAQCVIKRRS